MKLLKLLLLFLIGFPMYAQEVEVIHPFYIAEIREFTAFYNKSKMEDPYGSSTEYGPAKLNRIYTETSTLPRVNSVNSKFYKEGGTSTFEIYGQKNISMKIVATNDKKQATIYLYAKGKVEHEIPYANGKVNGVYKVFKSDGTPLFETEYKDGKMNGHRKFYTLSSDRIIEADFVNGVITGKVKVTDLENKRYMLYPNNFQSGVIEYYDATDNLICEVPFVDNNVVQGEVVDYYYHSKNKRLVRNHNKGKLDGKTECFDRDGKSKYTLNFKDGQPIGTYKEFYLNGGLYKECFYDENGVPIGTWKTYDRLGKINGEVPYSNGVINGVEKIYNGGYLIGTREYKDGKMNGSWKHWETGTQTLVSDQQMVDGKCVQITFYFKNGTVSKRYENDAKELPIRAEYFDKNGNLFYEEPYNADKSSEGTHKFYYYDQNEDYFLGDETEYDKAGFRVRQKLYLGKEDYEETKYKLNNYSIKTTYKDHILTTEYYYFTKKITEEEFSRRSSK